MQIIRSSSLKATPWKNGGGITREFLRVPAEGDRFRWRLSVAQIDVSGPFSDFAGYRRIMVLLRGSGVRLSFDNAEDLALTGVGALIEFDGALKSYCQLLDGPCTDLNLMVDRSSCDVSARVEQVTRGSVVASPRGVGLIFSIVGGLMIELEAEKPVHLEAGDLAIVAAGEGVVVTPAPEQAAPPSVFFAMLDDNSP